MAIEQYNPKLGKYEEVGGGNRGNNELIGINPNTFPTNNNQNVAGTDRNIVDPTRNSDYLRRLLENMQSRGYRGGGGYNPNQLSFEGFSDRYNKYRGDQTDRIEGYMTDPRGYNDREFAMMQGRGQDAIVAQGGGFRQMMKDAITQGGINSGSVYGSLNKAGANTTANIANMERDLALGDMNLRREQQQAALGMGSQWAGQMSSDDRWLTEGQLSVDSQNEQNRARAAANRSSSRTAYENQLLAMQMRIGESDVEEGRYLDDQAWRWRGYGNENRAVRPPPAYNNPYN